MNTCSASTILLIRQTKVYFASLAPSVMRALKTLEELGIVKEITGKERHKVFVYNEHLDILSKGTEPLKY